MDITQFANEILKLKKERDEFEALAKQFIKENFILALCQKGTMPIHEDLEGLSDIPPPETEFFYQAYLEGLRIKWRPGFHQLVYASAVNIHTVEELKKTMERNKLYNEMEKKRDNLQPGERLSFDLITLESVVTKLTKTK